MSQPGQQNPYASSQPQAAPISDIQIRPGGVNVTAVLCILGGIIGVAAGVLMIAQMLLADQIASMTTPPGAAGKAQQEMQATISAATGKYTIPNVVMYLTTIGLCVCLLVGGIGLMRDKLSALALVRKTLLILIFVELIRCVVFTIMQLDLAPVVQQAMEKFAEDSGGPSAAMMGSIQKMSMIIGIVFWVVWIACKIAIYVWGRKYLDRDHVRAYFSNASK